MASQRERLLEGMIEAAARRGYRRATVAGAIERAGVSRATFYEHFANREECFLLAYRSLVARLEPYLEQAERAPAAQRPRQVLATLLTEAGLHPAAARVMTIEALASRDARAEREQLLEGIEAQVHRYLDALPDDVARPQIPPRALIGGVEGVIAMRVFRGEPASLGGLLFDLLAWLDSYGVSAEQPLLDASEWSALGARLTPPPASDSEADAPRPLPRGRAALPRVTVEAEQRERILAALARLSRTKGYAAITISAIVGAAHVTRGEFYRQFRNKEEAILASQTFALQRSISLAAAAFFGVDSLPDRAWAGLEALLAYVASEPDLAWLDIVESYAIGPAAIRRSFDNRTAFTLFLEQGYRQSPRARRLPEICSDAIGCAILELLRTEVLAGRSERVLEILPQVVYVALAPFIGPQQALELVREKVEYTGSTLDSHLTTWD
jgi:AcrR family transcriptional regulator